MAAGGALIQGLAHEPIEDSCGKTTEPGFDPGAEFVENEPTGMCLVVSRLLFSGEPANLRKTRQSGAIVWGH
jgi:hypothetical protein